MVIKVLIKAWQVQACPELGTAQPQLVCTFFFKFCLQYLSLHLIESCSIHEELYMIVWCSPSHISEWGYNLSCSDTGWQIHWQIDSEIYQIYHFRDFQVDNICNCVKHCTFENDIVNYFSPTSRYALHETPVLKFFKNIKVWYSKDIFGNLGRWLVS